jgi:hypothetical protein
MAHIVAPERAAAIGPSADPGRGQLRIRVSVTADGAGAAARFARLMNGLERHWREALESAAHALGAISLAHELPAGELASRKQRLDRERAWASTVDWSRFGS